MTENIKSPELIAIAHEGVKSLSDFKNTYFKDNYDEVHILRPDVVINLVDNIRADLRRPADSNMEAKKLLIECVSIISMLKNAIDNKDRERIVAILDKYIFWNEDSSLLNQLQLLGRLN